MAFSVSQFSSKHTFEITCVSYAGKPLDHSAMYITKKVERLVDNLRGCKYCLVFVEDNVAIPEELTLENVFVKTPTPQKDYAQFVERMWQERKAADVQKKYTLTPEGYYIGENVVIGENAIIEPRCLIGHGVIIGKNALIKSGACIKNAVIGDNFIAGENCAIGTFGFTMADDENGDKIRIPTLGRVVIGNNVEIGALSDVSCGSAGDTILEDHVKVDALVHISHDDHLYRNVEITSGAILGGFDNLGEGAYVGINATTRNRIDIGAKARVSMGAAATKSVPDGETVSGNFAIPHQKFMKNLKKIIEE